MAYELPSSDSEEYPVERALHDNVRLKSSTDRREQNMIALQSVLRHAMHSLQI